MPTKIAAAIPAEEAAEIFRRALLHEIPVSLVNENNSWDSGYPLIEFRFGDWTVCFFNDAGDLDYTEYVKAPDGRRSEFDDWCTDDFVGCPLNFLTFYEQSEFADLLRAAK